MRRLRRTVSSYDAHKWAADMLNVPRCCQPIKLANQTMMRLQHRVQHDLAVLKVRFCIRLAGPWSIVDRLRSSTVATSLFERPRQATGENSSRGR